MDKKIYNIHTIYDLIIYAYEQIGGLSENRILSCYLDTIPEYRSNINSLLRETLMCNLTVEDFVNDLIQYLEIDSEQVCMHILMEFDHYYSERNQYPLIAESATKSMIDYPTRNNISNQLAFYPMFQNNFIMNSDIMSDARVHRIREGIWDWITSYRVNRINDFEPYILVRKYNKGQIEKVLAENECIKMAVIPFSNEEPFDRDKETGILKYKQYNSEIIDKIYTDCITLLEELDKMKIDIVIFPEIVMTEKLIDGIRKWLMQKSINGSNIKLIFMGSYYTEDINRCVLLSGTGKLLLSNDKQNGFAYVDNSNRFHRENLGDKSNIITLIDIKGLGRVWYLICKDALVFDKVVNIMSHYGCNVQMISSYSKSLSDFQSSGEVFAKQYQVLSVVANSCAVRKGKNIGVISYPVFFNKDKNISSHNIEYSCSESCEKCSYSKCAHVFQFDIGESSAINIEKQIEQKKSSHKLTGIKINYTEYKRSDL